MLEIPTNPLELRQHPAHVHAQEKLLHNMRAISPDLSNEERKVQYLWQHAKPELVVGMIEPEAMKLLPTLWAYVRLHEEDIPEEITINFPSRIIHTLEPKEKIVFTQTSCAGALRFLLRQREKVPIQNIDEHIRLNELEARLQERYNVWMDQYLAELV